ncbi:MAG: winged helix-turn-helix domain-containing protein, partial [Pseudomonadota bacterium]
MHYQLEDRALFPSLREVWNGKKRISVEPKVFDLLLHLVKNRGRVVEKDELIDEIWCGRAISDAALSSAVKAARQAMGDSGATQSVIKTLHGKGFRLVGRVEEVERDEAVTDASNDATAGIDLNVPSQASVAIFPFETIGESQCKILAQALSQDITVGLARTRWLFVTSGSSARQLQANGLDANDAGRRLGVRYVLRGSVIQFQNRLRLNVALSEADTEADIWAETFDRKTEDVLQTMQDVANSVVTFVENEIHLRERRRAVLSPIASLDAWAACHRAIDCLYRFSHHAYDEVDQLLQHASRLDPSCARVTAARSFLYWQKAFFEGKMDRGGAMDRAIEFAQESVVLDPHDPQSHWALGRTALMSDYPADAIPSLTTAV